MKPCAWGGGHRWTGLWEVLGHLGQTLGPASMSTLATRCHFINEIYRCT